MKIAKLIIGFGIILAALGALFQFQGRGVVGPESSFMYHSKDWIYYGIAMIISGAMIVGLGVFVLLRARLRAK
ncbi:hypothetical protein [Candidatus Nitrosotenuis cloacae]|uniref:Uncharacterized protein n=1 Tax=Candidatus Nitrosotenuis cloacae TaxID=1603555 RepID=A0A3G1B297_9ARCH|nr:hypothetical protein [Candidatus Nitrosotenuis cloacae]AJZ75069.1 hypothetical protein SU86_000165 [Candidatus Nitrosotenuis cloacae]